MTFSTDGFTGRARAPAALALLFALGGCASGPREKDLLPDEGPTTLEVYERHMAGEAAPAPAGEPGRDRRPPPEVVRAGWAGEAIAPEADADSRGAQAALDDLRRDFRRVPNPEIVGYVYPHLGGDLPVPGYYTAFTLREGARYAAPGEGVYAPEGAP
ncbi:MAG: hypothetical protein IPK64_22000 [bacterium]|nr:hypothetical protein [bacterium]